MNQFLDSPAIPQNKEFHSNEDIKIQNGQEILNTHLSNKPQTEISQIKLENLILELNKTALQYLQNHKPAQALNQLHQALKQLQTSSIDLIKDSPKLLVSSLFGLTHNNLGCVYKHNEDYDEALRHFKLALAYESQQQDKSQILINNSVGTITNICTILSKLKLQVESNPVISCRHQDALQYAKYALKKLNVSIDTHGYVLIDEQKPEDGVLFTAAVAYFNSAVENEHLALWSEAEQDYEIALQILKSVPEKDQQPLLNKIRKALPLVHMKVRNRVQLSPLKPLTPLAGFIKPIDFNYSVMSRKAQGLITTQLNLPQKQSIWSKQRRMTCDQSPSLKKIIAQLNDQKLSINLKKNFSRNFHGESISAAPASNESSRHFHSISQAQESIRKITDSRFLTHLHEGLPLIKESIESNLLRETSTQNERRKMSIDVIKQRQSNTQRIWRENTAQSSAEVIKIDSDQTARILPSQFIFNPKVNFLTEFTEKQTSSIQQMKLNQVNKMIGQPSIDNSLSKTLSNLNPVVLTRSDEKEVSHKVDSETIRSSHYHMIKEQIKIGEYQLDQQNKKENSDQQSPKLRVKQTQIKISPNKLAVDSKTVKFMTNGSQGDFKGFSSLHSGSFVDQIKNIEQDNTLSNDNFRSVQHDLNLGENIKSKFSFESTQKQNLRQVASVALQNDLRIVKFNSNNTDQTHKMSRENISKRGDSLKTQKTVQKNQPILIKKASDDESCGVSIKKNKIISGFLMDYKSVSCIDNENRPDLTQKCLTEYKGSFIGAGFEKRASQGDMFEQESIVTATNQRTKENFGVEYQSLGTQMTEKNQKAVII